MFHAIYVTYGFRARYALFKTRVFPSSAAGWRAGNKKARWISGLFVVRLG
jgi:hypothetical protein